jgi:integrase
MSVRRQKRTEGGKVREFWIVDLEYRRVDGSVLRIRRVPRPQTKATAEKLEREILNQLEAGTFGKKKDAPVVPTLAEFAKRFLRDHARVNNKASEVYTKGMMLKNHILPALGKMRLDQIDVPAIERYKGDKKENGWRVGPKGELKPYSAKSINNQLGVLRTMLELAEEWGIIQKAPKVKALKAPDAKFVFLDFDEAQRLKDAATGEWRTMIVTALNTGMRLGELLALEWDDIDLVARHVTVSKNDWRGIVDSPKGTRTRILPLNDEVLAALKAHRHLQGPLVFCRPDGGRLDQDICRSRMRAIRRRAGIKPIQWHGLRHSFGSHLAMRGVPLKAIQELMGHATIEMTMRYAHLTPNVKEEAVRMLIGPARPPSGHKEGVEIVG